MPPQPGVKVLCRQIAAGDLCALADLLAEGFPARRHADWVRSLEVLSNHEPPEGFPKFGYMLESGDKPVGVILLITTNVGGYIRSNVSSWYVRPEFRSHAALLNARVLKHKGTTYLNISAAPNTWPIIEVQGFQRYRQGVFVALPALARVQWKIDVQPFMAESPMAAELPVAEREMIAEHAGYGCICLCCRTPEGVLPFVFRRRRIKRRLIPCAQLVYCRDIGDLRHLAGPIGRYLILRGIPVLLIDADGPISGLKGKYFAGQTPFFAKGPDRPHSGDLTYTEAAMFGY